MDLRFSVCLPRDRASVPIVRRLCGNALRDLGVSEECIGDVVLALTEACTNVLKHAGDTDGEYQVDVDIFQNKCEISVADSGAGFDPRSWTYEATIPPAEGGRGLHLMSALSDEVKFTSKKEGAGNVVRLSKALDLTDGSVLGMGSQLRSERARDRTGRGADLY